MTFLSQPASRRGGTGASRRSRLEMLRRMAATIAFLLAVSFMAAFVVGVLGH
ncbi:MAG TPA: hypothetical protein VNS34_02975 [Rhizobiaceae bacterium]|nr:hypothetical protein [Rhizobiaceae bacterium]